MLAMLVQLATVKTRLGLDEFDVKFDALLISAIGAISARFDRECNRTFGRTVDARHEFDARELEIRVPCYPIETVTRFELKGDESTGWVEQTDVGFIIRRGCVISLQAPLGVVPSALSLGRVTYTGGYVLPGTTAGPGQTVLPADLEQAAVEQVAYWFQNREKLGLLRIWPHQGTYQQFAPLDLLPSVEAVVKGYWRWG